jgi:dTDP-4-dehydrorhamnose 3,5-epimerase-like enzyme
MKYKELYFNELGDERGHLVVAESKKDIPFEIRRIFYMFGSEKGVVRGQHANRRSEFVLINVQGTSKVLIDDGKEKNIVVLDKPHKGVYLNKMIWKDMYDFSEDSILLVLSNEHYDGREYIRNYDDFLNEVNKEDVQ